MVLWGHQASEAARPSGHPGSQAGQDVGGSPQTCQANADVQVPHPCCAAVQQYRQYPQYRRYSQQMARQSTLAGRGGRGAAAAAAAEGGCRVQGSAGRQGWQQEQALGAASSTQMLPRATAAPTCGEEAVCVHGLSLPLHVGRQLGPGHHHHPCIRQAGSEAEEQQQ